MWTLCYGKRWGVSCHDTLEVAQEVMLGAVFRPSDGTYSERLLRLARDALAEYRRRGVEHFATRLADGLVSVRGGVRACDKQAKPVVMAPFQEVCLFTEYGALLSRATIWEVAAKSGEV